MSSYSHFVPFKQPKPRLWYDAGADFIPEQRVSIDIEEYGPRTVRTGLLDADGNPIYRTERKQPIGFVRVESDE